MEINFLTVNKEKIFQIKALLLAEKSNRFTDEKSVSEEPFRILYLQGRYFIIKSIYQLRSIPYLIKK